MKTILYCLLILALCAAGYGYQYVQTHPALRYYGMGDSDTTPFEINDGWELSWVSAGALKMELIPAGGGAPIEVTQTSGLARGFSFRDKGGQYTLRVHAGMPWLVTATNGKGPEAAPSAVPVVAPAPAVALGTPSGTDTPAAESPAPAVSAVPVNEGSSMPNKSVVLIKGDKMQGTGFLVRTADGPAVITSGHVIGYNPNFKILTTDLQEIKPVGMRGAPDRDMVELLITDANYTYLNVSKDAAADAHPGDDVLTPGNGPGGDTIVNLKARVQAVGPLRIEMNNPVFHGNSGGPILQLASGAVLGVETLEMAVDRTSPVDLPTSATKAPVGGTPKGYVGLRLDNVPGWEPYDLMRFQTESIFLDQFHAQSRRLDALLNPHGEGNSLDMYKTDDVIKKALLDYVTRSAGLDAAGRAENQRELVFNLQALMESNMRDIQNPNNFYTFDRKRAQEEAEYRRALAKQLDDVSKNGEVLDNMARTVE